MTNPQIERRLAALEESMGTADAPALDITLVFVEPVDGCFGGRIKRVVKWSELTARKGRPAMMERIRRQLKRLEELSAQETLRVRVRITFVSPADRTRSAPMTLEEIAQRHRERRQGATHGE